MRHTNTFMRVWVFGLPGVIALLGCNAILGVEKAELDETIGKAGGAQGGAAGTAGQAGGGTAGQGGTAGTSGAGGTAGTAGGGGTGGTAGTSGAGGTAGTAGAGGTAGTAGAGGTAGTAGTAGDCVPGAVGCRNITTPQVCDSGGHWQNLPECPYVCLNGACGGVCAPGLKQCLGNTPQVCVPTGIGWVSLSDCPQVCKNGACVDKCNSGDKQCVNAKLLLVCNGAGDGWEPSTNDCQYVCNNGACEGECNPGETRCNPAQPNEVQFCDAAGGWKYQQLCQLGCDSGECQGECKEGDLRCTPGGTKALERCIQKTWQPVSDCNDACVNGNCVECYFNETRCDPNNPDNVQPCDNNSFKWGPSSWCGANLKCSGGMCVGTACVEGTTQCSDGKSVLETCSAGTWIPKDCPPGSTCANNVCTGCANGEQRCQTDMITLWVCSANEWQQSACPYACINNACSECNPGNVQCPDSSHQQLCDTASGKWGQSTPCGEGENCQVGVGCTCITGARRCIGNMPQECNAGVWNGTTACAAVGAMPTVCKQGYCACDIAVNDNSPVMVPIGGEYCMDRTEVTRGQYQAWANQVANISQPSECSWNTDAKSFVACGISPTCTPGTDCDLPQTCIDWCDAYAFCKAMGKRLCGRLDGGSNATTDTSTTRNTWFNACSAGGNTDYGYGDIPQDTACNGPKYGLNALAEVGSISTCHGAQTPSLDVYDLSGNAGEWVDTCDAKTGAQDQCHISGGSFNASQLNPALLCGVVEPQSRGQAIADVGFRCCSRTQPPHIDWVEQAGNDQNPTELVDVVAFPNGDSAIAGMYAGADAHFGKGSKQVVLAANPTGYRSFVARYGPTGDLQWAKECGGYDSIDPNVRPTRALAQDPSGAVLVTGTYRQPSFCGDASHQMPEDGSNSAFVARFNPAGDVDALVYSTGPSAEGAHDVSYEPNNGGFIMVGGFGSTMHLSSGSATALTAFGGTDAFVALHDKAGALVSLLQSGGTGVDYCRSVVGVPSGFVAAYGFDSPQFTLNPENATPIIINRSGAVDAVVVKRDLNGNVQWVRTIHGSTTDDNAAPSDLLALPDGKVLLLGWYNGSVTLGPPTNITFPNTKPGNANYMALYDTNGDVLWARQWGRPSGPSASAYVRGSVGADGSFYVGASTAGGSASTLVLGSGESNEVALHPQNTAGSSYRDAVFAHYNWDGTVDWANIYGQDNDEIAGNLAVIDSARGVAGMTFRSASVGMKVGPTPTQFPLSAGNLLLLHFSK